APQWRVAARQEGDRGRSDRGNAAFAIGARVARPQPGPGDAAGEAMIVEPGRIVLGYARRQDLGVAGAGRRLEALQLAEPVGESGGDVGGREAARRGERGFGDRA